MNEEKYKKKNITISVSYDIIKEITNESMYEEFGARKIDKIIKDKIEKKIIDALILNKKRVYIGNKKSKKLIKS